MQPDPKKIRISFSEASNGLPELPAIPSQRELIEERRLREDAPLLAELTVRKLLQEDLIGIGQVGPLQEKLAAAFANPKTIRVRGPKNTVLEIPEVEHLIRSAIPGGYPPPEQPPFDPDGWIKEPQEHQIRALAEAIDLLDAQGKLKPGIERREAILRLHKAKMKLEHAGIWDGSGVRYAQEAGILK